MPRFGCVCVYQTALITAPLPRCQRSCPAFPGELRPGSWEGSPVVPSRWKAPMRDKRALSSRRAPATRGHKALARQPGSLVTVSPCSRVTLQRWDHVTVSPCSPVTVTLQLYHTVTLQLCHPVTVPRHSPVPVSPCGFVTLELYHPVSLQRCPRVTLQVWHPTALSPCPLPLVGLSPAALSLYPCRVVTPQPCPCVPCRFVTCSAATVQVPIGATVALQNHH